MPRRPSSGCSASAVVLAVVVALGAAVPATAGAASSRPVRCDQLKGRDLLPANPRIRLVRRAVPARPSADQGPQTRYLACSGAHGRVRTIDQVDDDSELLRVKASSGRFFVTLHQGYNLTGDSSWFSWRVNDAASGRSYSIFTRYEEGDAPAAFVPRRVVLDATGRSAVAYGPAPGETDPATIGAHRPNGVPVGATAYVASFGRTGTRTILDTGGPEIAPASLTLTGSVLSWTHGAETRSKDLGTD